MSWCQPCEPYQPLPISTGAVGIDRCGNIEVYAAPSVVRAPVRWGCWPIQFQGWWLYQGPFGACPPGWSGGGSPPTVWPWGGDLAAVLTQGAKMAEWMIAQRRR